MTDTAALAPHAPPVATARPWWTRLHPIGWLAGSTIVLAIGARLFWDTEFWIGNLVWWNWLVLAGAVAMGVWHDGLDRLRRGVESIATFSLTVAWILAWVVFLLQLFNVITRYGNDLVETDILFGETTSLAWQSFGLMFLIAINFGVREGVNPRIDFWWANFSAKRKAWLDFIIHSALLLPFIVMAIRILKGYAATSLGRRHNGEWPSSWRVWGNLGGGGRRRRSARRADQGDDPRCVHPVRPADPCGDDQDRLRHDRRRREGRHRRARVAAARRVAAP